MLYFGSPSCEKCIRFLARIGERVKLDERNFRFINGDDFENEETQALCDKHEVDDYPHVKIFVNGELKYEEVGDLDVHEIGDRMTERIQVKVIKNESKSPTDESNTT